jgi:hypothetical protein
MPLINFKTDFTTLKYGLDRPGGGDSGQPYIQFPIETANTGPNIKRYYEINRTSLDFPIRGGAITQLIEGGIGVVSSTIDRERIQKFFKDAPRGTAFIQKQVGLQLTNPKTQVPNSLTFAGPSLGNAVLPVTNVYNPLNTLAQVQVMGTGAHFNRHGVAPTLYESAKQTYEYIAGAPQNNTGVTNRLAILRALKLIGDTNFLVSSGTMNGIGIDPFLVDRLGISTIQNQLFNYSGGPGSVYGLGFTRIFRATNTQPVEDAATGLAYSTIAFTYNQLAQQNTYVNGNQAHPRIQDFRAGLTNNGLAPEVAHTDYTTYGIEPRLNVGNPGAKDNRLSYTDTSKQTAVDQLNALNPFYYNPNATDPWTEGNSLGSAAGIKGATNDIIKFGFECIDNDNPEFSVALMFRAFLDGQIADNHSAEYNSFKYLGRGETFRTYQGFDRSIGFSFKIFTQTRSEMLPLYRKLNQLISQVYPDYSSKYNLMRGNVVKVTIGDYIYRMPGFLENVNVTIDNSNTPWEIVLNEGGGVDDDVRQLPHMVTVQCSFKPILNILPRKESYISPFVPLIVNKDDYLYLAPPAVKTNYVPELESIQATPSATGATIKPFTGYVPPPVQKLPPPTKQNIKKVNHAKLKKQTRTTVTNTKVQPIFKNTTPMTLTDTIGIGSAEGRRQAEILKFRTNTK